MFCNFIVQDPEGIFETLDHATEGGKKHLSVEKIYKKLSQLDHVLIRPDTYVGSIEQQTEVRFISYFLNNFLIQQTGWTELCRFFLIRVENFILLL